MTMMSDDDLGRVVRETWIEWARRQPDCKPSWLVPWDELDDAQREVDRLIGVRLYHLGCNATTRSYARGLYR